MPQQPKQAPTGEPVAPLDRALDGLIGYVLSRVQIKMFQNLANNFAEFDIRPTQFSALFIIHQNPGLMQAELARTLAIDPPQAVVMINKLEQQGLALRIRCKADKRSHGLFLSKSGEVLLKKLEAIAAQSDLESTSALSADECSQLLTILGKLYRN